MNVLAPYRIAKFRLGRVPLAVEIVKAVVAH
jgi:hypothetical protein